MNKAFQMMFDKLMQQHPEVANNPRNKEMLDAIKNNNEEKGIQIAMNLCNTYGSTKEDAIAKAKSYFGLQ